MPTEANGVGTMYYRKKNREQHEGICVHCHNKATLSSYDATAYFTCLDIPIVPLGKKHIIDDCSSCERHFKVPLSKWRQRLKDSLREAQSKYSQNPNDADAAKELITALSANNDKKEFLDLADEILENHFGDHEMLSLVAAVFLRFHRHEDAERLLVAAVQISNDDQTIDLCAEVTAHNFFLWKGPNCPSSLQEPRILKNLHQRMQTLRNNL